MPALSPVPLWAPVSAMPWIARKRNFERELEEERAANEIEIERVRDDLLKLTLDSEVSFDYNSAEIKPAFQQSLTKARQCAR